MSVAEVKINLPDDKHRRCAWRGLPAACTSYAIAQVAIKHNNQVMVVLPDVATVNKLEAEISFFLAEENVTVLTLPDWETLPYDRFSPHQDITSQRLTTLAKLPGLKKSILLVSISTLMQLLPPTEHVQLHSFNMNRGDTVDLSMLRTTLINNGYYCVNQVREHGEFALRGSIIDLYPMGSKKPYRIDLLDNEIDTIREFDPDTQLSVKELDAIRLLPAREFALDKNATDLFQQQWVEQFGSQNTESPIYESVLNGESVAGIEYYLPLFFKQMTSLFDYLQQDALLLLAPGLYQNANNYWQEIVERYEQLRYDRLRPLLPPNSLFQTVDKLYANFKIFKVIEIHSNASDVVDEDCAVTVGFDCINNPDLTVDAKAMEPLFKLINYLKTNELPILLCAESRGRQQALYELFYNNKLQLETVTSWLEWRKLSSTLSICVAPFEHGFCLQDKFIVITETDLFGQQVKQRRIAESSTAEDTESIVRDLTELHIGDPVVHLEHGIGRYQGLTTLTVGDIESEYLTLEYASNSRLYIPISSLHLIARYMGANPESITFNSLGAKQWQKAKHKALEKIYDVAADLLEIYAHRAATQGLAYKINQDQYKEFANSFPFEPTTDQQRAIDEVLADMQSPQAMDRLVCGDVGFGKTEVAMRAAFIAVANNKQVAILVPTTLLTQQHLNNFRDRFADYPVTIAALSRYVTKEQQTQTISNLAEGKIDIIIGTHRLLQQDIKFKNLGLLIIDEEHLFGVKQKEKIKGLRSNVDILTLTATPIPRTLNLSLAKIRDLSIIATPPARRLSIKTFVIEQSNQIVKEAILREIMRGGQVFYLHNDVKTISHAAQELKELMPNIRLAIAHGQLRERELERVMTDFYHQRYNVLVCSTIIESGIDIPTANTIIINRADRFGLAQLHQLRGRVGRSHHQAYAYLIIPGKKLITSDARKRLEALESMEDLGAGFALATYDLEIRGAGEILGEDQSGQIQAIGFNLYMEFLDAAVKRLRSGKKPTLDLQLPSGTEIDLPIPALLPDSYIYDVNTRLRMYKRIASAKSKPELHELQVELVDRFGLLPDAAKNLFTIMELKLKANVKDIIKIKSNIRAGYLEFTDNPNIDQANLITLIQTQSPIFKLEGRNRLKFTLPSCDTAKQLLDFITTLLKQL